MTAMNHTPESFLQGSSGTSASAGRQGVARAVPSACTCVRYAAKPEYSVSPIVRWLFALHPTADFPAPSCGSTPAIRQVSVAALPVSTDPASNVGQVFGITIGNVITPIENVPHLFTLEIDPQAAAQQYRDRIVGPVRGVLPDAVVKSIEEQLSGACTTEIAAFDELLADTHRADQG